MKAWPSIKDYTFVPMWVDASGCKNIEEPYIDNALYERARADAAVERLRVAVAALKHYESIIILIDDVYCASGKSFAFEALREIGPLP